jgi:23S rRNA pseudouridine1911/1915/1917 synthase
MAAVDEELPGALGGERVDRVVALLTGCSRAEAASAVDAGTVAVDGNVVSKSSVRVQEGQRIVVESDPITPLAPIVPAPDVDVVVVFEDRDLIVVDKPAGLVTHPGAGTHVATLAEGLLARYPELSHVGDPRRPGIVHRLDKGTSGLLVVARSPQAYDALVVAMTEHSVDRHYSALAWGEFEHPRGTIDAPIGRSRRDPVKMTVAAEGKPARTHYRVIEQYERPSASGLLSVELETGRTHQIRVHLRSIGHPVVGDTAYGGTASGLPLDRPFLHSTRLELTHPITGDRLEFESELPDDLVETLAAIQ